MNNETATRPSFMTALRKTFGEGQPLSAFSAEAKNLDANDRADYSRIMTDAGIDHEPPAIAA